MTDTSGGRYETIDEFLLEAERASHELTLVRRGPPLRHNDIALVTMVRNEEVRLPAFLNHYRNLGIDTFFVIDNGSTDDTRNILSAAGDVEVWTTRSQYRYGRLFWLSALIHVVTRTHNNWVMVADADEFLVYDGMDSHDLHDLADLLDRLSERRLRAIMIDVYGRNPIGRTPWPSGDPLKAEWYFDPNDYEIKNGRVTGGARSRVFSTEEAPFRNALGKFPMGRFDSASGLTTIHKPYPFNLNKGPIRAAMVHFKFTSDFFSLVNRAVREKQFWQGSREYRIYQQVLSQDPELSLYHQGCQRLGGASSLRDAGLIVPIDWEQSSDHAKEPLRHQLHARVRSVMGPHFRCLRRARKGAAYSS